MTKTNTSAELLPDDVTENALAFFYSRFYTRLRILVPVYIAEGDEQGVFMRVPTHGTLRWERINDSVPFQLYPGTPRCTS